MSCHIGYFDGFKYDVKFDKDMRNIIPELVKGNATLCFNWPGHEKLLHQDTTSLLHVVLFH